MAKELTLGLDSRIAGLNDEFNNFVKLSGMQYSEIEYTPDGSDFSQQIQFQSIVPVGSLTSSVLSRVMSIRYRLSLSVAASANPQPLTTVRFPGDTVASDVANGPALNPNVIVNSALRAFPLQSICDTVQVQINNSNTTWNARITLPNLLRILKEEELKKLACPSRPDNAVMCLPAGATMTAATTASYGYSGQPLSLDIQTVDGWSRNSIRPIRRSYTAGSNTALYEFELEENLIVPGINTLYGNECYLPNVNNLSIMLNYSRLNLSGTAVSDIFNSAPYFSGGAYTLYDSTVTSVISAPRLVLRYLQVDPNLVKIPRTYITNYENVNWFYSSQTQTIGGTGATSGDVQFNSDTFRLTSVPKLILVSCAMPMASRNYTNSDSALSLASNNPLSITFGNRSGLLANSNCAELYRMSKQNGSNQTYNDWLNGAGAFLVIDPVKDFGLNPEVDGLPGENNSLNLQINMNCNCRNLFTNTPVGGVADGMTNVGNYQMIVVVVYNGQLTITPDQAIYSTQTLTPGEVKALVSGKPPVNTEAVNKTMDGKGLFSEKTIFHKTAKKGGVLSMA